MSEVNLYVGLIGLKTSLMYDLVTDYDQVIYYCTVAVVGDSGPYF